MVTAKRTSQKLWWHVHHWAGLKLSLLMAFILFTGTLATVSHEIDWLIDPARRVDSASVSTTDWAALTRAAVERLQPGERIESLEAPVDPWFAAQARIEPADSNDETAPRFVLMHPSTAAIQGERGWINAQRILRNVHRHLLLPTKYGVPIVSALSLLLLALLISALIIYKKWWRGGLRPPRWRDARTAWGDVHRLAGVWSLWFVALVAVTGFWYLVESLGGDAPPLPRAKSAPVDLNTGQLPLAVARSVAAAQVAFPGLKMDRILFPTGKLGAFQIHGEANAVLVRPRANAVWVHAATGQVLQVTRGQSLSVHQRISEAADPLHFGTFGGLLTKLIWFVFGLLMTLMSLSGAAVYTLRISRGTTGEGSGTLARLWRGMGIWRWVSVAGLLVTAVLLPPFVMQQFAF
jgi:uncharacterized iron-regulated membrane protein